MSSQQFWEPSAVEATVLFVPRAVALKRDSGQELVKFYILSLYPSLLDRTHEFQARRRAIEAVSALAGVELAITGIISDPGRHRI